MKALVGAIVLWAIAQHAAPVDQMIKVDVCPKYSEVPFAEYVSIHNLPSKNKERLLFDNLLKKFIFYRPWPNHLLRCGLAASKIGERLIAEFPDSYFGIERIVCDYDRADRTEIPSGSLSFICRGISEFRDMARFKILNNDVVSADICPQLFVGVEAGFDQGGARNSCGISSGIGGPCGLIDAFFRQSELPNKQPRLNRPDNRQQSGGQGGDAVKYEIPPFGRRFVLAITSLPLGFGLSVFGSYNFRSKRRIVGAALIVLGILICWSGIGLWFATGFRQTWGWWL